MSSTTGGAMVEPPVKLVEVWFPTSGSSGKTFGMRAEVLSPDRIRMPFVPPTALDAATGDIFRVERGADGKLWVQEKLDASGYCAILVVPASDSPLGPLDAGVVAILEKFTALGVTGCDWFGLVVIDVPPDAQLRLVRELLDSGRRLGWWDFDELSVTDTWKTAALP